MSACVGIEAYHYHYCQHLTIGNKPSSTMSAYDGRGILINRHIEQYYYHIIVRG